MNLDLVAHKTAKASLSRVTESEPMHDVPPAKAGTVPRACAIIQRRLTLGLQPITETTVSQAPSPRPQTQDASIDLRGLARQRRRWEDVSRSLGTTIVGAFHYLMLFVIGAATVWAAMAAITDMVGSGHASLADLLLLFIYLELGAMVGIYFQTNHMPVRFLIYVGITALTRHLIDLVNTNAETITILVLSGSVMVLALSEAVLRFASFNYPSDRGAKGRSDAG
jgi:phosphate starvation-inducible membrane PsiE